ncbi:C-5 sterol desaturase [Eremomyces bilateralis CBS 781.70]|uniref:C-5 sterol desaturase n=1 Tax=Eremomyces bilateralis CBS 781.70 TaxID=1392243 RepID=A0A6G1G4Z7_9PEZI|nr:C-5 sterol desaturase [Eremomyces bilateralis CBS 781.70]KAF1813147.1 C-5 sterol desaturase [Eremomyces bilateralis CBS 781.70]
MDIVLEFFDRYVLDRVYAACLPAPPEVLAHHSLSGVGYNASLGADGASSPYNYQFTPASKYISFEPTPWAYMSRWPRDNVWRQALSLFMITWIFGYVLYFGFASFSYYFIFDKATFKHPKYLKHQISLEIKQALTAIPFMVLLTCPCFLGEVRGYSKMYDTNADGPGTWYNILQFPLFILFTDFFIYWIHRGLHHPLVYKRLHKPHHKWIMPTPYASHAFNPLDGFAQSIPYHVYPYIFPLQKWAYVVLFVFINIWTIMIHDGEYATNSPVINGAACHTMHHLYFNYNYGQFTTLWDRLGNSYRKPNIELFYRETKFGKAEWTRQTKEMETIVKEVEGEDDRSYEEKVKEKKVK